MALVFLAALPARAGSEFVGLLAASKGTVLVDDVPAPQVATLASGTVVKTEQGSAAVVKFKSGTMAVLGHDGEISLAGDADTSSISLRRGGLVVQTAGVAPAQVIVLGRRVIVRPDQAGPGICRIAAAGEQAAIFADRGRVEVHSARRTVLVPRGSSIRLEAGPQQAGVQKAGSVSNTIPEETIQRQGQGPAVGLKIRDDVDWKDVVQTLNFGRVRIQLLDGSFLNIGARSTMRIERHDPQTQQTQIILTLGRMRSEVKKLTKPGGSFQVQTQTAVIGVVGTDFVVEALPDATHVFCLEGIVTVRNLNPAITGAVALGPGQQTSVLRGRPPSMPSHAADTDMQNQMTQTDVSQTAATAGEPPSSTPGPPPSGQPSKGGVLNGVTRTPVVIAAAAAAGAGALAYSQLGNTNNSLQSAIDAANAALAAATDAAAAAAAQAGSALSPSSCGCQ